jgi:hypothetical protein
MKNMLKLVTMSGLAAMALIAGCVNNTGTIGRGAEIISCTSGMNVTIACGASSLGSCAGDPILTVCDGATTAALSCDRGGSNVLGSNDDSEGRCPSVTVVCPTSGMLAVKPTAFSGTPTCNWATRESGA